MVQDHLRDLNLTGRDLSLSSWSVALIACENLTPNIAETLRQIILKVTTLPSPNSRRNYGKALDDLFAFSAGRPLTRELLMEYRASLEELSASTINVRLSAVRKMAPSPAAPACSEWRRAPT